MTQYCNICAQHCIERQWGWTCNFCAVVRNSTSVIGWTAPQLNFCLISVLQPVVGIPGWADSATNTPPTVNAPTLGAIFKQYSMQKVIFIICFAFITNKSISQNLDSILANPPIIELQISNPQPRLGDNLVISYDASFIQGQIFKSALPELIDENDNSDADERKLNLSFKAKKLGKVSVGPFSFTLNGINFRTSNLTYEVINKLPQVAEGVWIRNVKLNDSISCVILEQRIPTERKTESLTPNTTRYWSEPLNKNQVEINYLKNIKGVRKHTSMTNSSEKYIYTDSGERLEFQYILSVAYYEIVDKSIPIEITKDWFNNLPPTYKFENIKIQ